jgi:hypothetical protein
MWRSEVDFVDDEKVERVMPGPPWMDFSPAATSIT